MTREQYERLTALITDCLLDLRFAESLAKETHHPKYLELLKAKLLLQGIRSDLDREQGR